MSKARNIHKKDSVMSKLLENNDIEVRQFYPGELVEGIVVSASHGEILLDVGAKSEGIITGEELGDVGKSHRDIEPGDKILATVLQAENDQGYIVLSLKRAERERRWVDLEEAYKSSSVIEVEVLEYNKGGLLVDCLGQRGFVPLSHLDRAHLANDVGKFAAGSEAELKESLKVLAGKKISAKIIELDPEKNRLVLSEKDALSTYSQTAREERLSEVSVGDIIDGIVTGVMPFGIFVDMEGIEGLVHISEIAWEKVSHPSDYYSVGAPIQVKVLGIDDKSGKLALSVKQLTNNPWDKVEEKYPVGTIVEGVVSKVVPFGAFVNLEKGLDGLVHISEAVGPMTEGEKVKAVVSNVDAENQKLALSIRQLEE